LASGLWQVFSIGYFLKSKSVFGLEV